MLTESPLNGVRKIRSRAFRLNPRTRRRYSPPRRARQTTRTATRIDRQPDGDEPDGQGRVGALLGPVSVSAVAPGRRRECEEARDGRAELERSPTALRDHVSEATRGDLRPQGAPSSPTLTVSRSNL